MRKAFEEDEGLLAGEEHLGTRTWSFEILLGHRRVWGGNSLLFWGTPFLVFAVLWFSLCKGETGSRWKTRGEVAEMRNTGRVRDLASGLL